MHGILLIDKPEGYSSHQIVKIVKRRLGKIKVGHTGTLDPAASGLLVILTGVASRSLDYLDESRKRYILGVRLGETSDTCDREGQITITSDPSHLTETDVLAALEKFRGPISQVPPHFSAIKQNGSPLYKLARKGIFPEVKPRPVNIFELSIARFELPDIEIDMTCSKGTYARSLARDLGEELLVGARLESLRRLASGAFDIRNAVSLEFIDTSNLIEISQKIIPLDKVLQNIPQIITTATELKRLTLGGAVRIPMTRIPIELTAQESINGPFRVSAPSGGLLVIVESKVDGDALLLSPSKVFNWLESSLS